MAFPAAASAAHAPVEHITRMMQDTVNPIMLRVKGLKLLLLAKVFRVILPSSFSGWHLRSSLAVIISAPAAPASLLEQNRSFAIVITMRLWFVLAVLAALAIVTYLPALA